MDEENIQDENQGKNDDDEKDELYITRKIRIYPNKNQKILFNKCIGTFRYFYNKANEYIKNLNKDFSFIPKEKKMKKEEEKKEIIKNNKETRIEMIPKKKVKKEEENEKEKEKEKKKFILPSSIKLRKNILTSDSKLKEKDKWQSEVPYDTRELAIRRLRKSYVTAFCLLKNNIIEKFDIKYKKKKNNKSSFEVNKKAIKITKNGDLRIFPSRLKQKIRIRKRDRKKIKNLKIKDIKTNTIIKKENNKWYICINIPKENIPEKKEKPIYSSVFLDPGTRKFQNFYSPDGICGHIGERICEKRIKPLIEEYENKQKLMGNKKNKIKRKNIRKRCRELITKVQNIVSDLHNQTANFLSTTFESIFIPIFETRKMIEKNTRKITKKTVKELLHLSHYKFRMKLKNMCKLRKINYKVITEEFTSKICSGCGKINNKLGGKEIFKCNKCELEIDRDLNASRNICILNIKTRNDDKK